MKQLTDDLQDRVIELLVTSLHFTPSHEPNIAIDAQAAILELRALPDVPIAQPVFPFVPWSKEKEMVESWTAQQAQPERAPLSLEKILEIVKAIDEKPEMSHIDVLVEMTRSIEAAHGIKQGGQQ